MSRAIVLAALALGTPAAAGSAQAQPGSPDRYGATVPAYPMAGAPSTVRGRMLAWPGKTLATAPAAPVAYPPAVQPPGPPAAYAAGPAYTRPAPLLRRSYAAAPPAYAPPAYAPQISASLGSTAQGAPPEAYAPHAYAAYTPVTPAPQAWGGRSYAGVRPDPVPPGYTAPQPASPRGQDGWRPVPGRAAPPEASAPALAGAPQPAALPTSIYTSASAPSVRGVSADRRYGYDPTQDHSVRFYSVHRPFGLQPDPAPIPPQFFTATADLSQPQGPLPSERTTTSSGGTTHTVRAAPDTGAQ